MTKPCTYTEELGKEICHKIACTPRGIHFLCKKYEHWPKPRVIFEWLVKFPLFKEQYLLAKKLQVETLIDEILAIADDSSGDFKVNDKGNLVPDSEHINRSRLRVDTRKWIASKLVPKLYGDKIQTEVVDNNSKEIDNVRDLVQKCMKRLESQNQAT